MLQLAVLLAFDGVFYLLVIPAGIVDPPGFGIDEGLPPSFSARLIAMLVAVLMVGRLLQLLVGRGYHRDAGAATSGPSIEFGEPVSISPRSVAGIAAAMVFATVLTPYLGFVPGGLVLLPALLAIMGERRATRLALYPAIVMLMVWLLFEKLLSIRLPVGVLFAG